MKIHWDARRGHAADFYDGYDVAAELGISADTTDDELAAMAEEETRMAAAQDPPQLVTGIEDYLRDIRDALR